MRLKTFYAKTMAEAMQMVRDTLGEDAIIVATREENAGKAVRVTAALEDRPQQPDDFNDEYLPPAFEVGKGGRATVPDTLEWLQYDDEEAAAENVVSEDLTDLMLRHAIPEDVTDQIISCATVLGIPSAAQALMQALEQLYSFRPIGQKAPQKALMLVGPPGAGKTLAAAKLATRAVMSGQKTGIITTDTIRAGGIEQLQAFTKILKTDLHKAESPDELKAAIRKLADCQTIIIDTAGTNPFDAHEIKALAQLVMAGEIEPVLVLPAGGDATESGELGRIFAAIGARRLIATRLDIARRLGGILSAVHSGGLALSEISATPQVADGLVAATPKVFAQFLMPGGPGNRLSAKDVKTPSKSIKKRLK